MTIPVTKMGITHQQQLATLFLETYYDSNTKSGMIIFDVNENELDGEAFKAYERFAVKLISGCHFGFSLREFFTIKEDKVFFMENTIELKLYETYVFSVLASNLPYQAIVMRVSQDELLVVGLQYYLNGIVVGLINTTTGDYTLTASPQNYMRVLGELHCNLLFKYLARDIVGDSNE